MSNLSPLAQTFMLPKEFTVGACITSIDLYFSYKAVGETEPVTVHIVETLNGYPTAERVPGAKVIVYPDAISASSSSLIPTKFKFYNLVQLESNKEYAIKVMTNSSKYKIWTSVMGETRIDNPGILITQQPALGSLFKSQNNSTWTPEQLQDLSFTLNYAKFDTSKIGTLTLVDNTISRNVTLPPNPFKITNTKTAVKVNHPNHGLAATMQVTYSGSTVSGFNSTFTVASVIDSDHYIITTSAQSSTDQVGGNAILVEKSVKYDSIMVEGLDEGRDVGIKVTSRLSGLTVDTVDTDVTPNVLTDLVVNKYIHTSANKTALLSGANSFKLQCKLSSFNTDLSPIISLDDIIVSLLGNRINTPSSTLVNLDIDGETIFIGTSATPGTTDVDFTASTNSMRIPTTTDYTKIKLGSWVKVTAGSTLNLNKTGYINSINTTTNVITIVGDALVNESAQSATVTQYLSYVNEIANGGSAESKYITKTVKLQNPAAGFRIIFAANIHTDADLNMYYRTTTHSSVSRIEDKIWTKKEITYKKSMTETEFTEFEYDITNIEKFDSFQFKFVFLSSNTAVVPKIKKLRIIAHA